MTSGSAHEQAVEEIAVQVKSFHERQKPFRLYHGSTNSTRASQRRADNTIDTSRLDHVLSVDTTRRTALVEPNVPMDQLVQATLARGLVPPVVMEFPGITVGGGFSGTSGESSSFRHGAFESTMESIEMVLGDGTVVRASRQHRPEVFWGAASAFGTLGVVTLLEVRLLPARKLVELRYCLCRGGGPEASHAEIWRECEREANDFVDAIVFDPDTTLVCCGRMTDEVPVEVEEAAGAGAVGTPLRTFSRRSDPWFYVRAREVRDTLVKRQKEEEKMMKKKNKKKNNKKSNKAEKQHQSTGPNDEAVTAAAAAESSPSAEESLEMVDYMPLAEYLFRYDRGAFWVGKYSFRYFLTPFNRITRFLLDDLMHTRVMYRAVHRSGLADHYMVQDVGVPADAAPGFQDWLHDTLAIYPLWLCPLRVRRDDPDAAHGLHASFADPASPPALLNFGVWGPPPRRPSRRQVVALNRALEAEVQARGGKKWLYAHAYYTEDEFWRAYDRPSYDSLRRSCAADHLPSVYDKVKMDVDAELAPGRGMGRRVGDLWPLPGLRGFYAAVRGGDYLMNKTRKDGGGC